MQDNIKCDKFYEDLFKCLMVGLKKGNKGGLTIGANINVIINEARRSGYLVDGMEKEFLKDMFTYFEKKGIKVVISNISIISYLLNDTE